MGDWMERERIPAWLAVMPGRGSNDWAGDWGLGGIEVLPGAPRAASPAGQRLAARIAELDQREREISRRELRVTVLGYTVALCLALEVLLAVLVVSWGNHRLDAPRAVSATTGRH